MFLRLKRNNTWSKIYLLFKKLWNEGGAPSSVYLSRLCVLPVWNGSQPRSRRQNSPVIFVSEFTLYVPQENTTWLESTMNRGILDQNVCLRPSHLLVALLSYFISDVRQFSSVSLVRHWLVPEVDRPNKMSAAE